MFSLFKKKTDDFFSTEEKEKILSAIQKAEHTTSGEIRVYVEKRCRFVRCKKLSWGFFCL